MIPYTGSDEQKFLEASIAYVSGKPIMNDKEFDELKLRLKVSYFHFINENQYCSGLVGGANLNWCELEKRKVYDAHKAIGLHGSYNCLLVLRLMKRFTIWVSFWKDCHTKYNF